MAGAKIFISDLEDNTTVETIFLVAAKAVRETKNGDPYLCVTCQDRTGTIEARVWDNVTALQSRFEAEDFVAIRGRVSSYRDELQLTLSDIERVSAASVELSDFLPHSRWTDKALFKGLKELVDTEVQSAEVRRFLDALFSDEQFLTAYKRAPAAVANHHNYLAGLLEHSLSMARLAVTMGRHYNAYYPGLVDTDLLIAGCIIHDMGKVEELGFQRVFEYTTAGKLLGHIPMAYERIGQIASAMSPALDRNLEMQLKHLVLSHHGRQEYGSPVVPRTAEATLLHFLDMIDSRMNMCFNAVHGLLSTPDGDEGWSDYQRLLNGSLYVGGTAAKGWKESTVAARPVDGPGVDPVEDDQSQKAPAPSNRQDPAPAMAPGESNPNLSLFGD